MHSTLSTVPRRAINVFLTFLLGIGLVMISATSSSAASLQASNTSTAEETINEAREADPEGFNQTVEILESSPLLMAYLNSYEGFDAEQEVQVLATQFNPDAAQAFVEVLESGELTISAGTDKHGNPAPEVNINPDLNNSGEISTQDFPQCPSAWAALYAWAATEAAFCGALGLAGPGASLACVAAFTVIGTVPDFNAGC